MCVKAVVGERDKAIPVYMPSNSHCSVRGPYRKLSGPTCHHVQLDVCWKGKR